MASTITIVNELRINSPELKQAIDRIIESIEDLKIDGLDIKITLIQNNRVTVDVNPIGVSEEIIHLLKLLDDTSTGRFQKTGMTHQYFEGYFSHVFWSKTYKAFPNDTFLTHGMSQMEAINKVLIEKKLEYRIVYKGRAFDSSGERFYYLLPLSMLKEV